MVNNYHFVVVSRYCSKGPYHIKGPTIRSIGDNLNCADSRLLVRSFHPRGYAEILVDLEKTDYFKSLWVAYYFEGIWRHSEQSQEMMLCKKCAQNILIMVQEELNCSAPEKRKMINSNQKLIDEALTSWSRGEPGN